MNAPASVCPVLARDPDGEEHELVVVDHPAGFVSVVDGDAIRILAPKAAVVLAVELIGKARPAPGVMSSTF